MCPAFSIGKQPKKASFIKNTEFPGVGSYKIDSEIVSTLEKAPSIVIGKTQRTKTEKEVSPGPHKYDLSRYSFFNNKKSGFTMGGRSKRVISEGPGPGDYQIPRKLSNSSKYHSILQKRPEMQKTFGPGPAHYQVRSIEHAPSISFEKSQRNSLANREIIPGPNKYNISPKKDGQNKFSFTQREKFYEEKTEEKVREYVPGPGSYNPNLNQVKKQIAAAKFNKTKRQSMNSNQKIPGPGAYEISDANKTHYPVASICHSPRSKDNYSLQKRPGPSTYSIGNVDQIKRKDPRIIFGRQVRERKERKPQVGPGSYDICVSDKKPAYSISQRNSAQKFEMGPGPEAYSPKFQVKFRKSQYGKIGKEVKFFSKRDNIPGPADYETHKQHSKMSKSFYFPKQVRRDKEKQVPGPGAYNIKPIIGSQTSQVKN